MPGTAAFRSALADALPERPFRVVLWDGSELESTTGNGGPTFIARSPQALAHVLRHPGELGLGRALVRRSRAGGSQRSISFTTASMSSTSSAPVT